MCSEKSPAKEFEALFGFAPLPLSANGSGDITGREVVRRALRGLACEFRQCQTALAAFLADIKTMDVRMWMLTEVKLVELQGEETRLRASLTEARDAWLTARLSAGRFYYLPSS